MNNVPTRVLAEDLERARHWVPWPVLMESEQPVPITEPDAVEVEEENEPEESDFDEDDRRESQAHSRGCVDECMC